MIIDYIATNDTSGVNRLTSLITDLRNVCVIAHGSQQLQIRVKSSPHDMSLVLGCHIEFQILSFIMKK